MMRLAFFRLNKYYDLDILKNVLAKTPGANLVLAVGTEPMKSKVNELYPNCLFLLNPDVVRNDISPEIFQGKKLDIYQDFEIPYKHFSMAVDLQDRYEMFEGQSTIHQRQNLCLKSLYIWKNLLKHLKVEVIIQNDIPHTPYEILIDGLAQQLKIKNIVIYLSNFSGYSIFMDGIGGKPYKLTSNDKDKIEERLLKIKNNTPFGMSPLDPILMEKVPHNKFLTLLKMIYSYFRASYRPHANNYYIFSGKKYISNKAFSMQYYKNTFDSIKAREYYISKSEKPNLKEKFIYFPLHFYYENTTQPSSFPFTDIVGFIDLLDQFLPDDILIYIKEHPAQISGQVFHHRRQHRSKQLYDQMLNNKRVRLISYDFDRYPLIDHSLGTLTGTGSTTIESIVRHKSALYYGDHTVGGLPGTYNLRVGKELAEFVKILKGEKQTSFLDLPELAQKLSERLHFTDYFGCFQKDALTSANCLVEILNQK